MQVLTPVGEALWPSVFKPSPTSNDSDAKEAFQLSIMYPHDDEDKLDDLKEAIEKVAVAKWGKKAAAKLKSGQLRSPIRDGDEADQDYLEGHYYIKAKSDDRPEVVDEDLDDIINTKEFYGGCECRMDVWVYAYEKSGNKGVGLILNNVQKTGEGERKGGGRSAASAFGDDAGGKKSKAKAKFKAKAKDKGKKKPKGKKKKSDLL